MAFRLKKNQYWFKFTCTACDRPSRYAMGKGEKFSKQVVAKLRCTECAWGGPGGLKRHQIATERAARAVADLARRSTGCSPGPDFYVQLWATAPEKPNPGVFNFRLADVDGRPMLLQVLIRGEV